MKNKLRVKPDTKITGTDQTILDFWQCGSRIYLLTHYEVYFRNLW